MPDIEIGKASIEVDVVNVPPSVQSLTREVERYRVARQLPPLPARVLFSKPLLWRVKNKGTP